MGLVFIYPFNHLIGLLIGEFSPFIFLKTLISMEG